MDRFADFLILYLWDMVLQFKEIRLDFRELEIKYSANYIFKIIIKRWIPINPNQNNISDTHYDWPMSSQAYVSLLVMVVFG